MSEAIPTASSVRPAIHLECAVVNEPSTRNPTGLRFGVIGAGVSGIAAASILNRNGHTTVLFEKHRKIGGVWAVSYPRVALQNTYPHYELSEYPWPFKPDFHPSGAQIERYLGMAVEHLGLDVRLQHEVFGIEEKQDGWIVRYRNPSGEHAEEFDYLMVAVGQYTQWKHRPEFPGESEFAGRVITERDVDDLELFRDRKTVVVGFGKSAVDMATLAVETAEQVHHLFRTPRWLIPFHVLGIHYSTLLFCRASTVMIPCWDHPTRWERFLHRRMPWMVNATWALIQRLFHHEYVKAARGKGAAAAERIRTILPGHSIVGDLRSATALAPVNYFDQVANGEILPYHAALEGFTSDGVELDDGRRIRCDQVLLCVGSESPRFPFFPEKYRGLVEGEPDGVQLYRHMIHPRIPRLAFAGYNHGFMHIPTAEVSTLWLCAVLRGDLTLPGADEMQRSIARIRDWKRAHINFEPSRSCAVNTRFQQYIDTVLKELGLPARRKLPNIFAEMFAQYGARDYYGLTEEYNRAREKRPRPVPVLPRDA